MRKECGFSLCLYRHKSQTTKGEEQTNTIDNEIVTVTENAEKSKNEMEHLEKSQLMKTQLMKISQPLLFTHLLQRRESFNVEAALSNPSLKTVILTITLMDK